jgi:hypothetical protein
MEIAGLGDFFFSLCQTRENPRGPIWIQKCLREQDVMTSARTSLWKYRGQMYKHIRVLFSSPLTSTHEQKKKKENLAFDFLCNFYLTMV